MTRPNTKIKEHYTYSDYCTWDDDFRCELIDGVVYAMTSPLPVHQIIQGELFVQFRDFLKGKSCMVIMAPSDVRLNATEADDTVVQPDLYVFCDKSKFEKSAYVGTPELAVEITSPSTTQKDKNKKFQKYLQAKVPEYWIVEPESRTVIVNLLDNDRYETKFYHQDAKIAPSVLDGCEIDFSLVFGAVETFEESSGLEQTGD